MIFSHDDKISELTGETGLDKAPAIGGNEDGWIAGEKSVARVGRDEGGEDGPLTIGEIGGEDGMTGRKG